MTAGAFPNWAGDGIVRPDDVAVWDRRQRNGDSGTWEVFEEVGQPLLPVGAELRDWKQEHNRSHIQVRARVEHTFARTKAWKILCDCHLKGDGVHHVMLGTALLRNLILAGQVNGSQGGGAAGRPVTPSMSVERRLD